MKRPVKFGLEIEGDLSVGSDVLLVKGGGISGGSEGVDLDHLKVAGVGTVTAITLPDNRPDAISVQ